MTGIRIVAAFAAVVVGSVAIEAITSFVGEEARTRIERIPYLITRLAAWLAPHEMRDDLLDEWGAELAYIARAASGLPVTRLVKSLYFAVGLPVAALRYEAPPASAAPTFSFPSPWMGGQNCTVMMIDIARFSGPGRTDGDRLAIVNACYRMLKDSFSAAGVDWGACRLEDRREGVLVIIPGHVPTEGVVNTLMRRLAANLRWYNRRAQAGQRFRLRAAVDVGPVMAYEHGVSGETLISVARLLEASRLKTAVLTPGVIIGIATSPFVFERVARHLPGAELYEQVRFQVKEWKGSAWMRVYRA